MVDGSLHPNAAPLADEVDDDWAQLQFRQLQELAEIGMTLARALPAQLEALRDDPSAAGQLNLTFSRLARAVRQTHALEARLRRELKAGAAAVRAERKAQADASRAEALAQRKAGLRRAGRQTIADHEPVYEQGGLTDRLNERIEDLCEDEALLDRPFSTVLMEICEALGLTPDWTVWRREPWAVAEVRDRPPGSEYARFHDDMVAEGEWEDEAEGGDDVDIAPDAHPPDRLGPDDRMIGQTELTPI
jgi:hypothetical protein